MDRVFVILAAVANVCLLVTVWLGWSIGDPNSQAAEVQSGINLHMLTAVATAIIVLLVHAVSLTYFMGTGRWIEETSAAYRLGDAARRRNIQLKYRAIPGMVVAVLILMITVAFGAMSDPAADLYSRDAGRWHFWLAVTTLTVNLLASALQYDSIQRNGQVVNQVVAEVGRIRTERGLEN